MNCLRLMVIAAALSLCVRTVYAQLPAVQVWSYGQHLGANIVYNYRVVNNGSAPISQVEIGHHLETGSFIPGQGYSYVTDELELDVPPLGVVSIDRGSPASSSTSPAGWKGNAHGQEENPHHSFVWEIKDDQETGLMPGQMLEGFSVTVPSADSAYLKGHFYAIFRSGQARAFTALMQPLDTAPPTLSVSLSPATLWPPNNKLIPVAATITVKDDYDPAPEIKLESITANEPLDNGDIFDAQPGTDDRQFRLRASRAGTNPVGRIYTITYSATDASGNRATANATVTVPHDQGK